MPWFNQAVLYIGLFDAGMAITFGLIAATMSLLGRDFTFFWERVAPAGFIVVIATFIAAVVLALTRWVVG